MLEKVYTRMRLIYFHSPAIKSVAQQLFSKNKKGTGTPQLFQQSVDKRSIHTGDTVLEFSLKL